MWGTWGASYLSYPNFKIKAKRGATKNGRSWKKIRKKWVKKLHESRF